VEGREAAGLESTKGRFSGGRADPRGKKVERRRIVEIYGKRMFEEGRRAKEKPGSDQGMKHRRGRDMRARGVAIKLKEPKEEKKKQKKKKKSSQAWWP